jgi:methionine sulfoxide reductase heme-binding subunit
VTTPLLWYLNRGTGVVLLVVMTLTTILGVLATGRATSALWPRFVTQGVHRILSGLAALLLLGHAAVAVIDEYVDIRWWQAIVPVGGTYKPVWLGLGALALDLVALVVATSLVRSRLSHRFWFLIHLWAYAAWAVGLVHGFGIGTDSDRAWLLAIYGASLAAVALAVLARLVAVFRTRRKRPDHPDGIDARGAQGARAGRARHPAGDPGDDARPLTGRSAR